MTAFDFYGLWTWNDAWTGMSDFLGGASSSIFEMGVDIGRFAGMMGEWMYADFQYEYANDSSLFALKSERALDSWKGVGQFAQAAYEDPLLLMKTTSEAFIPGILKAAGEAFIPGIMEVWRDPTSARAWGQATSDVVMIATIVGKVGRGEKVLAGVGSLSREASVASKCAGVAREGDSVLNFALEASKHMRNVDRAVPIQILNEAIQSTKGIPDPRGSRALMHYSEMWKNGQKYNLEILYDKSTNSVWHFKYNRDPLGPLQKINKS